MGRNAGLFAVAALVVLIAGLVARWAGAQFGLAFPWKGVSYGLSFSAVCYFLAALFASFAFVYSIGAAGFTGPSIAWHFRLSALFAGLLISTCLALGLSGSRGALSDKYQNLTIAAMSIFVLSIPAFVGVQVWFGIEFARGAIGKFFR